MKYRGITMKNLQSFAKEFQQEMKWDIDTSNYERSGASLVNNFMLLTTGIYG